ncbi:hypothetical protein JVU11DRAFT_3022 [Chiua virens]|nr:hypothetical protein JVU11DRAFT_3022 [Chiua virens]
MLAALWRDSDWYPCAVQSLLRTGADMLCKTGDGDTSLRLAVTQFCEMQYQYLVKTFSEAGCDSDPASSSHAGRSVFEVAIDHGYSALVEYLLACGDINLQAPVILLVAMQYDLAQRGGVARELLVRNSGTEPHLHSTTNEGAPALHLVTSRFPELICARLVMSCIEAGWNPDTCNLESTTVLTAAMEMGYTSVVELLLSYNFPLPPDILGIALWLRSSPGVVKALVHRDASVDFINSNGPGITLFQVARALYVEPHRQQIIEILRNATFRT